jgi:ABC-type microcin C transport system permease subunit YejB
MIYIYFYLKNSILISRGIMFFNVVLTYLISIYLMIQSIYKLNIMFDWFNLVYLIIGITLFVYANYLNFRQAYYKHRSAIKDFGYKNLYDFYKQQQ